MMMMMMMMMIVVTDVIRSVIWFNGSDRIRRADGGPELNALEVLLCASKRRPAVEHEFYVIIGHCWCGSSVSATITRTSGFGGGTRSFDCHRYHIALGIDISISSSSSSSSSGSGSSGSSDDGVTLCSLKKWTSSSMW